MQPNAFRRRENRGTSARRLLRDRLARHRAELRAFFRTGLFIVEGAVRDTNRYPKVSIKADDTLVIALRLARAGYWDGDPEKAMAADPGVVIAALQYEVFRDEYERTYNEMNREKK